MIELIKSNLTPDLLKGYKFNPKNPFKGHCYIASECYYHLLPNKENYGIKVASYKYGTHWWIENKVTKEIIDITASQFKDRFLKYLYKKGRFTGFLTKKPSKRTRVLLSRITI